MDVIDLALKREYFLPAEQRYLTPHKEIIKIRRLWATHKPLSKSQQSQQARSCHQQALKAMHEEEEGGDFDKALRLTAKGLFFNVKFHPLYALRGDICMRKGQWINAIKNYETARAMAKFDFKLTGEDLKQVYFNQLVAAYRKRGDFYYSNDMFLEALSDYEHVLLLKLDDMLKINIEDKLLKLLRKLDKYELFQRYWDQFLNNSTDPKRSVTLLSMHAEYKIHRKQMALARLILLKALDLDPKNVEAQKLLDVIYNAAHTLSTYAIIWCFHGCYDKALISIEKALECNPHNPGFTLLKTIILRLSGRLIEATAWLDYTSENFSKLTNPHDVRNSITGRLTVSEARHELIKQWYLIRYNKVMNLMLEDKLEYAARIIYHSQLTKHYVEPFITLGDIFFIRDNPDLALNSYLHCYETSVKLGLPVSRKIIDLIERIIDILNEQAQTAVNERRFKDAINITNQVLKILDENQTGLQQFGVNRGRALFYKAQSLYQIARNRTEKSKPCCEIAADSLRFIRQPENMEFHRTLYGERSIENIIDQFAPKRKLPRSLKIVL